MRLQNVRVVSLDMAENSHGSLFRGAWCYEVVKAKLGTIITNQISIPTLLIGHGFTPTRFRGAHGDKRPIGNRNIATNTLPLGAISLRNVL